MAHILSVSCDDELKNIIKEKNLSPSECFRVGVMKMALANDDHLSYGVKFEETEKCKLIKAKDFLQKKVLEMSEEIEKLKGGLK